MIHDILLFCVLFVQNRGCEQNKIVSVNRGVVAKIELYGFQRF